jgi:hypothetical protein
MNGLQRNLAAAGLAVAGCLLATPHADARVFQRHGAGETATKRLESVGATQAFQSRVTVNGVGSDLTVFSFDAPLANVADRLRAAFGTNAMQLTGSGLTPATLLEGNRPTHVLVSEVEASRTLVFVMVLDRAPDASVNPPWPVSAVPLMPGGTTVFTFENTTTRMRFAIARTPDNPAAASNYCDGHLRSRGWEPRGPPQASLIVYTRGQDLCLVMVQPPSKPGEDTRIVVMEKRLGAP